MGIHPRRAWTCRSLRRTADRFAFKAVELDSPGVEQGAWVPVRDLCTTPTITMRSRPSPVLRHVLFPVCALLVSAAPGQDGMKSYGAPVTAEGAVGMADFAEAMAGTDSLAVKIECEIITSCTVKGCWMDVKLADGAAMKVRFKDYGFFVPKKGLEGKRAILQGYAKRETLSVEMLRHYAEDAGKSPEEVARITEPKHTLTFLAEGVLITR